MARRPARSTAPTASRTVRCAIYTRKSTEEGLDQTFNSLDAQREACAAYIASQKHEGWQLLPSAYDDGGFSGGTMERPGLKRLLADVEAGRVDVIVVYKVDRLTRALSDFAKIVDVLDARGASFVSVTQAFNTTTSMGRLTLNVLLSFAQFEREVTGERIRDKIAASKKKGMWMGGPVPLGYDIMDRKLIVNEAEAETVRFIFSRHRALGTISALTIDLAASGVVSKRRVMRDGRVTGQTPYTPGALTHLLRNVLYTGRVSHHGTIYAGEHDGILDQSLWDESQELLDRSPLKPRTGHSSLLNGLVQDAYGRKMIAAHAIKGDRRYRYYVSSDHADAVERTWRLPAGDLEPIVVKGIQALLHDPLRMAAELGDAAAARTAFGSACRYLGDRIADAGLLRQLGTAIVVHEDRIDIYLHAGALAQLLRLGGMQNNAEQRIKISMAVALKRRGHELRLVYAAPDANPAKRDERLVGLIASGHAAWEELLETASSLSTTRRSHLTRLARLRFLAPDIVGAIVDGRQPVELTNRSLLRIAELPLDWTEQRIALGFA